MNQNFDWAKEVPFRHDVWTIEFRFKPVRMIWVDVPGAKGQMQRKLVWYMVYSVTNRGKTMHPAEQPDGTYKVEFVDHPVRFLPVFLLEAHTRMNDDAAFTKVYTDHLIPVAAPSVAMREDPHRHFFNSVEIGSGELAVGKTAWGIATWEDVDPRTKWFSIYVEGLTNAYRWKNTARRNSHRRTSARSRRSAKGGVRREKCSNSISGGPATSITSTRKKSATESRDGLTTSGFIGRNNVLPVVGPMAKST